MKLRISKLPNEPLAVNFLIPPQEIVAGLRSDDKILDAVGGPMSVDAMVERFHDTVQVNGQLQAQLNPQCDRCLETFPFDASQPISFTCIPAAKMADEDEDEGVVPYKNDEVDLSAVIRGNLFFSLPIVFHCKESCRGLCPACGANLNTDSCSCDVQVTQA